ICYATQNRQWAVRELAKSADVILVVGSSNSSNSNRLREIGEECGIPSYLIADESKLDREWIRNARSVGLTAGASETEGLIERVIDRLGEWRDIEVSTLAGREERIQFRLPAELVDG